MKKIEVYYDGKCPMCTIFADNLNSSSKSEIFDLNDIHEKTLAGVTLETLSKEIHVKDTDGTLYKNADAILKVIGTFPRWRFVEKIGHLPIINGILHIGYNIVAQNRYYLFGGMGRLFWLKAVLAVGFIVSLLLSTKLWLTDRTYPLTPVLSNLPQPNFPFDYLLYGSLIVCLFFTIFHKNFKRYLIGSIILVTFLLLLDQSRLQPWVYQYTTMLLVLCVFSWQVNDLRSVPYILNISRFIVATIYFYSGLQKLNPEFIILTFPWMMQPITHQLSLNSSDVILVGITVPIIEMLIGLALLSSKFRNYGIFLATVMCLFVLTTLGPTGLHWNTVVWPWNVALLIMVFVLFYRTKQSSVFNVLSIIKQPLGITAIILFGIMPMTYFFHIWDSYPSWSLYSGTTNQANIVLPDEMVGGLPTNIQRLIVQSPDGKKVLSVFDWSYHELNVPPYPETRIYQNIARNFCEKYAPGSAYVSIVMRGRAGWTHIEGKSTSTCQQYSTTP